MLTADLVNARRRGSDLVIAKLDAESRSRAVAIAAALIDRFREGVGLSRDELEAELASVEVGAREQRMKDGLAKLLDDRATWDLVNGLDPEKVRRDVFVGAANARRALLTGARFDRSAVLGEAAR